MKNSQLSVLLFSSLILGLGCARDVDERQSQSSGKVRVFNHELPPHFVDVADVAHCELPVRNDTADAIHFTEVITSCSCADASLLKDRLEPGEETSLKLQISLSSSQGVKRTTCRLAAADGVEWLFVVDVPTYQHIRCENSSYVSFGQRDQNEAASLEVPLLLYAPPQEEPLRIEVAESTSDQIVVAAVNGEVDEVEHGIKRRHCRLVVQLKPHHVAGNHRATIDVTCGTGDFEASSKLHVSWQILSEFTLEPNRLFFGQVGADGDTVFRKVSVRRRDEQPFAVKEVLLEHSAFRVECLAKSELRTEHEILVTLDPSKLEKHAWTEMIVELKSPKNASVSIPLSALRRVDPAPTQKRSQ